MAELEIRHECAIDVEACAHPCAEGQHHLDVASVDEREAGKVRVVADPRGPPEFPLELGAERKARPPLGEIRRAEGDTAPHDTGKTHRNSRKFKPMRELLDGREDRFGNRRARRREPHRFTRRAAFGVEDLGLDVRAANVDAEGLHVRLGGCRAAAHVNEGPSRRDRSAGSSRRSSSPQASPSCHRTPPRANRRSPRPVRRRASRP